MHEEKTKILYKLQRTIQEGKKPIVFWVGAGVGKWCNYPLWDELAQQLHSQFLKEESGYNKESASKLIDSKNYPAFFGLCKYLNSKSYNNFIAEAFLSCDIGPVYKELLYIISKVSPLHIFTTNVDETLEHNLTNTNTLQNSDLERCMSMIQEGQDFLCKLHGSISSSNSLVFTESEYNELLAKPEYLNLMKEIFSTCTVVFLGYSLSDQYVMDQIISSDKSRSVFGSGPHFIVTPTVAPNLPEAVNCITYPTSPFNDHRSALRTVECVQLALVSRRKKTVSVQPVAKEEETQSDSESIYYLTDILAPGTWNSSQSFDSESVDGGHSMHTIVGQGYSNDEIPILRSTSAHDLVVGLMCFDKIYIKARSLDRVIKLIGDEAFGELLTNDAIRLVYCESEPAMIFKDKSSLVSCNALINIGSKNDKRETESKDEFIRRTVKPVAGKEAEAEIYINKVIKSTITLTQEQLSPTADKVRDVLCYQTVRSLIGISEGASVYKIPRWNVFPVQRLANSVLDSLVCNEIGASACKVFLGGEQLIGNVFSLSASEEYADSMASYTVAGDFNINLESVISDISILRTILKFRDTEAGISFRKEIKQQLDAREGNEFISSLNAGLKQQVPTRALQQAKDKFREILLSKNKSLPSVFSNPSYGDDYITLWKKRSKRELEIYCNENKITQYNHCPCGSGDKLKFCCQEALK
jgi:hypothetical protein